MSKTLRETIEIFLITAGFAIALAFIVVHGG